VYAKHGPSQTLLREQLQPTSHKHNTVTATTKTSLYCMEILRLADGLHWQKSLQRSQLFPH